MRLPQVKHLAQVGLGVAGLVLVAFSPFIVFKATRGTAEEIARYPGDVALVAVRAGSLQQLGIMRVEPSPGIVLFPSDTSLLLPRSGTLRAVTALPIVGPEGMNEALGATMGLSVPFWIQGEATSISGLFDGEVTSNLGEHLEAARASFYAAIDDAFDSPGEYATVGVTRSFVANARTMRALLREPALRAKATGSTKPTALVAPSKKATVQPKDVTVDVMNSSGVTNAASRAAEFLRSKGFEIERTGTTPNASESKTVVYFESDAAKGALVAKTLGIRGVTAKKAPSSLKMTADVIVLLGRDASDR